MRLFAEVLAPESRDKLRWQLENTDQGPNCERVSMLEYAETELVFSEFLRVLVRIADTGSSVDPIICERLSLPKCFEGFMKYVFIPGLAKPYPPEKIVPEKP